ncbi:magnesium transporter CorA family protein [Pseudoruegeria sp. SK021]|uniref:magnesium transporter CorA family protein n=1 Tax=Pseudoruegeria sp. SK021 TaxID=1933035 RepID=UPI000A23FF3E|nr:magnesium transporter CorA family protein [Pseudoruegeria sp. SK021]OSP55979.1 hypothetical protein BV911_04855 [Pseudoruegeria sp. SK021]
MLYSYLTVDGHLEVQPPEAPLADAIWIDLLSPLPQQVARVDALGVDVPSRQEMEEIELSNRLYHDDNAIYMTVMLPGMSHDKKPTSGPVTLILTAQTLVTVRHHSPTPFDTFAQHSGRSAAGCTTSGRVLLGLTEEIIGRLADLMEGIGKTLDDVGHHTFDLDVTQRPDDLRACLTDIGRQGERLNNVRLGLLTMERALSHFSQLPHVKAEGKSLPKLVAAQLRDIEALGVHADFLSQRIGLSTDTTLGMINLAQNSTARILSVVATLFMPPTLLSSIYGMNFVNMPELQSEWGYPVMLLTMLISALGTYRFFKWKGWL